MRRFLILLLLLLTVSITQAQTDTTGEGWEIVERCLEEPVANNDRTLLTGYIAYWDLNGIHAIRPELETPYYLAFRNPYQFVNFASISQDGRWLMIPYGSSSRASWTERWYNISELLIFSTGLDRQLVYRIPWHLTTRSSGNFFIDEWEGDSYFEIPEGDYYALSDNSWRRVIIDADDNYQIIAFTPTYETLEYREQLSIIGTNDTNEVGELSTFQIIDGLVVENSYQTYGAFYRDRFIALMSDSEIIEQITNPITLPNPGRLVSSPDGRYVSFSSHVSVESPELPEQRFYLLDMEQQIIIDTCSDFQPIIWSFDSTQFTFEQSDYDGLSLISVDDMSHTVLPYQFSGTVIGWYP